MKEGETIRASFQYGKTKYENYPVKVLKIISGTRILVEFVNSCGCSKTKIEIEI